MRESEGHSHRIYIREEEASSASQRYLRAVIYDSYRRLISSPHYKEADFEVAFSPGARVIWIIQQEPLPHNTVAWKWDMHKYI